MSATPTRLSLTDRSYGIIPVRLKSESPLYLLIQHKAGHWGFPKGHAKKRETHQQTACRECSEETGLKPVKILSAHWFVQRYKISSKGRAIFKTVVYFIGIVDGGKVKIQTSEVQNHEWLTYALARKRITHEGGRKLLDRAHKMFSLPRQKWRIKVVQRK